MLLRLPFLIGFVRVAAALGSYFGAAAAQARRHPYEDRPCTQQTEKGVAQEARLAQQKGSCAKIQRAEKYTGALRRPPTSTMLISFILGIIFSLSPAPVASSSAHVWLGAGCVGCRRR
ncbi:hypothetical protein AAFF_G00262960 [Aldrovandia affinis]|uniref:Secreted protein n=1 Tax=Aldrovandia affinis TaxID=143900 RepID=A0AAD7SSU9_9TELE|nr:hypothetical protein AAFF_G00262960 [Aldrovandia affinis]